MVVRTSSLSVADVAVVEAASEGIGGSVGSVGSSGIESSAAGRFALSASSSVAFETVSGSCGRSAGISGS